MRNILLLLTVSVLLVDKVASQTHVVLGMVTNNDRTPIVGVTVTEAGSRNGTTTNEQGRYTIVVHEKTQLVFTAVGYLSQSIAVNGNELSVIMVQREDTLQTVIVTAQGIIRRTRELGYSTAQLTSQDLTVGHAPQLSQTLSGKVSGLNVYNIDNSIDPQVKVVLRGYRSLTGNNEALLVIDGVPDGTQRSVAILNPNDVESVTVLKGGQAATLYGSAGVNGALLIATKTGTKGKATITYNITANEERISFLPWMQNQYGSGAAYSAAFGTPGYKSNYLDRMHDNWRSYENASYGDAYDNSMRIIGRVLEDSSRYIVPYAAIKGENKRRWNTGFTTNHHLSVSGGNEASSYYVSVEHNSTQGIIPGDKSNRTGIHAAAAHQYNQFTLNIHTAYVESKYDRTTANFYGDIISTPAHVPLSQLRDWRSNKFANPNGYFNDFRDNPYFDADMNRLLNRDANFTGSVEVIYKVLPWLHIYDRGGVINHVRTDKFTQAQFFYTDWAKQKAYVPAPWDWANDYNGILRAKADVYGGVADVMTNDNTLNNEFQIRALKDVDHFTNKITFGYSVIQQRRKQINIGSGALVQDSIFNVSNRQGDLSGGEYNSTFRKYSYYADLISGWKDMVFVHCAYRNDASSAFYTPTRNTDLYRFSYYGADVAFIATDAFPGLKSDVLSYVKVRAAVNRNANDNIDPFQPYGLDVTYNNGNGFPYGNTVGYTVGNILPDPSLKPEIVRSFEVGSEFKFLKNKLHLDITAYKQKSIDQILIVKTSNTSGFPFTKLNVGETKNWGYEADIRIQIIQSQQLSWELNAYYSYNDNKVLKLSKDVNEFVYLNFLNGPSIIAQTNIIAGQSFPVLKATAYVRDSATDRVVVDGTSGYPVINNKLVNFGRTIPPHTAGLGTRLRLGNLSLAANAEYRGGNVVFNSLGIIMTRLGTGGWTADRTPHIYPNSTYKDASDKYVPNNDVLTQQAESILWTEYYAKVAENFTTPAWFIKLREVNLNYTLPQKWMVKTRVVSDVIIGLFGRNLITVVDKKNYFTDPEFGIISGNSPAPNNANAAPPFTYNIGLTNGLIGINNTLNTPPVQQYGFNLSVKF